MSFCISIHGPREGHDITPRILSWVFHVFQSTCPARGTTYPSKSLAQVSRFQSTCPARGTTVARCRVRITCGKFQSTCPARGTTNDNLRPRLAKSISIHVPREGHDVSNGRLVLFTRFISIHVPREGHDPKALVIREVPLISIHVPREGHDLIVVVIAILLSIFQSTCPARGTTTKARQRLRDIKHFNPRAPRGARLVVLAKHTVHLPFQSTCPARGTTTLYYPFAVSPLFQSTCPARGTTCFARIST